MDGYQAALTNFRFLARDLWTTDEAMNHIGSPGEAIEVAPN